MPEHSSVGEVGDHGFNEPGSQTIYGTDKEVPLALDGPFTDDPEVLATVRKAVELRVAKFLDDYLPRTLKSVSGSAKLYVDVNLRVERPSKKDPEAVAATS